ncbi:MAG TPA: cytochrome c biogenesis protein CcsA [Acidimicrobiales bacterium]
MVSVLGPWLLALAAVALVAGAVRVRSRVPFVAGAAVALCGATALLGWALVTDDYTLRYVADTARRDASPALRLAGLWGAMAGSLLLWAAATATWAAVAERIDPRTRRVGAFATLAPVVALLTVSRPFERLDLPPLDGEGLAPILEHWAMLIHPPLLYAGLTGLVVPAALALTGAGAGAVRRWTLAALLPLTAGIALGARWAYVELGWGGFWAWDPIENGALLPWLAALGAVHERRAPPRAARLAVAAFFFAGVGTWLTRSGATVSVHAFAEARAVGWILLAALAIGLLVLGAKSAIYGTFRAQNQPRMSAATAVALASLVVVAVGTLVPATLGMALDRPRTIDPSFFTRFAAPPLAALAVLAAVAGFRRAPGLGAHAGAALVLAGAIGTGLGADASVVLEPGESASVGGHRITVERIAVDGRQITSAITIDGDAAQVSLRTSGSRRVVTPETALTSAPLEDVLVAPRILEADPPRAVLDVHVEPLASLVWTGAALAVFGFAAALFSRRRASVRAGGRRSSWPRVRPPRRARPEHPPARQEQPQQEPSPAPAGERAPR